MLVFRDMPVLSEIMIRWKNYFFAIYILQIVSVSTNNGFNLPVHILLNCIYYKFLYYPIFLQ